MPSFDIQSFARSVGRDGQSILGALDVQYGVPTCMMNLGKDLLSLIPSNVLAGMRNDMSIGRNAADAVTKALSQKLRNLTGIVEFDTDEGVFRFVSDASQYGQEAGSWVGNLGSFLSQAQQTAAFGSRLYANVEAAVSDVEDLIACLGGVETYQKFISGESGLFRAELAKIDNDSLSNIISDELANEMIASDNAKTFIDTATKAIGQIDSILASRIEDPDSEPVFNEGPSATLSDESVFRLNAGPPESKSGQFILSVDGLYYDSQTSGVAPALLELSSKQGERDPSLDWTFEFDPNLGGKGIPTTSEDLDQYFNTIFDPNLIDESPFMQQYYDADNTVVNIVGQRNRKIFDVSAELQEHVDAGSSQSLIDNLKRVMISESSRFVNQEKRRKKQIELAVKLPSIYGKGQLFAPGEVPVNDFSYLAGINYALDIQKQRKLIIRQDEVKSVVLPIETKFTERIQRHDDVTINHLLINAIPDGVIIDSAAASASVSASIAANPKLVEDGLFGLYNYLTLKTSEPSGTNYDLRNSSSKGVSYNAQLVGDSNEILDKGLGVAHLKGVCKTNSLGFISEQGTFAKLPSNQEFQDLIYGRTGATFESWVHTPDLSSVDAYNHTADVSGLYRLILANENTGSGFGIDSQPDIHDMALDNGIGVTRGLIFGFTRDRRFTQASAASNLEADNPTSDVSLVLAPTQSYDSSSAGFVVNKLTTESCQSVSSYKGLILSVSDSYNGVSLSACASSFCQLSVTFNPVRDEIKVYLDGTNLTTSSYANVFGVSPRQQTPRIPSIPPENTFEYNSANITGSSIESYKGGPSLDDYFTPWILGGGYTDGNPDGGFMGGEFGGKVSGLSGYLGCTRFYSKPLNSSEVLNNYKATKNFFKNIKI